MKPNVMVEKRHGVACLTLNRPDSMNALSLLMLQELDACLRDLACDETVRVLLVTGAGQAFCAGGDLQGFKRDVENGDFAALRYKLRYAQQVFERLERFPVPTLAAVNGYAIAGGLELLLCCDIAIASEQARIGDGHARYGVIPGGGSSARLPRKIAANRANYVLMSGELLPARQWQEWGLLIQVLPEHELVQAAWDMAAGIAAHSPSGMRHIKSLAAGSLSMTVPQACEAELDHFAQYAESADFSEGLRAFMEKRRPDFSR